MITKFLHMPVFVLLLCGALPANAQAVSFTPNEEIIIGPGCCGTVSGDFNGDGKLDLVVTFGTGALALLPGDGKGGFKPLSVFATIPDGMFVYRILAADVNHDGKLDLLVGGMTLIAPQMVTYVFLGKGDGTFQSPSLPAASGSPMFVGDVNGDGIPDLATFRALSCQGQIQLGNGDGTFQKPLPCLPNVDTLSDSVAVGDFNGDGILDFAWAAQRSSGLIHMLLGNGDGTFRPASGPSPPLGGGPCTGAHKPLAVGDVDHDGKLDLVAGGLACIEVFFGGDNGIFQRRVTLPLELVPRGGNYNAILVSDFNGDGKLDIVGDDLVLLGNGDGTFQPAQYFLAPSPGAAPGLAADFQGKGLPDLVFSTGRGLSLLSNNTPGPASSVIGHSAATGAGPVAPGSIASVYGKNLTLGRTGTATGSTLPTELGGVRLGVRDSSGGRFAPLIYVSPRQINFIVPEQTPLGPVVLTVDNGFGFQETANATAVVRVAPGIFTANGLGHGAAAATAVRVLPDGTQLPLPVFSCTAPGQCTTVPIDLSGGPVVLSLYGTGFRGDTSPPTKCAVGGVDAVVQFVGPQPSFAGLDQINILLPASLPSGVASVECFGVQIAPGQSIAGNPVQIEIK